MKRIHIYISGRVQFVAFRRYVRRHAVSLGLTGWVRNLSDGRVEIVAEGHNDKLITLVGFCKKGSFFAKVDGISVEEEDHKGEFKKFRILR